MQHLPLPGDDVERDHEQRERFTGDSVKAGQAAQNQEGEQGVFEEGGRGGGEGESRSRSDAPTLLVHL